MDHVCVSCEKKFDEEDQSVDSEHGTMGKCRTCEKVFACAECCVGWPNEARYYCEGHEEDNDEKEHWEAAAEERHWREQEAHWNIKLRGESDEVIAAAPIRERGESTKDYVLRLSAYLEAEEKKFAPDTVWALAPDYEKKLKLPTIWALPFWHEGAPPEVQWVLLYKKSDCIGVSGYTSFADALDDWEAIDVTGSQIAIARVRGRGKQDPAVKEGESLVLADNKWIEIHGEGNDTYPQAIEEVVIDGVRTLYKLLPPVEPMD